MRFRYFNPNPIKNNASDCVIRMLTLVTGKSWVDCYLDLVEKGLEMGDVISSNIVWGAYLRDLGFKRHIIPNTCPNCYSIEDFCLDHPHGLYVVSTGTHVVGILDSYFYDSWNSGRETPIYYWSRD